MAPPPIDRAAINDLFEHHEPSVERSRRIAAIRAAAKEFAYVLIENTPPSADQTAAVRKLRECVFTANASIVLDPGDR